MNNCPFELLELIISYLPNSGRFDEYVKVCRQWYTVISAKRYEEVKARALYTRPMQNLQITRIDGIRAIDLAQICTFGVWRFNEPDFQELMCSLPNLRVIRNIHPKCLPFLNNRNVLDHLTCLEEISMNSTYYQIPALPSADLFVTINAYLKNQITSLTIGPSSMDAWRGRYEDLITVLSGFCTLKNLHFNPTHNTGSQTINLTSIINACSSLVSLTLTTNFTWRTDEKYSITHTCLSSLELYEVVELTENHLEYMIQHLPNLKALTLRLFNNTFERVLALANPDTIYKFAIYLNKMEHVVIHRGKSDSFEANGLNEALVISKLLLYLFDQGCCCSLEAHLLAQDEHSDIALITKRNRNVVLLCHILLNSSNYDSWRQLDFSAYRSIKLCNNRRNTGLPRLQYDHNNWILQQLVVLLKQQHHEQECSIGFRFDLGITVQKLEFGQHGYISNVMLENELLRGLGQLYPLVETLELDQCMMEKKDNEIRAYQIDLTQFAKLQHVTFDLDALPPTRVMIPMYIKLIDVIHANTFEYCCYREIGSVLNNLAVQQQEFVTRRPYYSVYIYHTGIRNFTFKRVQSIIKQLPSP